MKKYAFLLVLITFFAVLVVSGFLVSGINNEKAEYAADSVIETVSVTNDINEPLDLTNTSSPNNASGDTSLVQGNGMTNVVIFICFADDTVTAARNDLDSTFIDIFNGDDNSLKDYYSDLSYGQFIINSIFPYENELYFVYKAPQVRSYYDVDESSGSLRTSRESVLLNGAVDTADEYFDYNGINLDKNDDSYVDCVSFVIFGSQKSWGGLLWPHSWQLDDITSNVKFSSQKLNGVCVNEFSFTFTQGYKVGYICHETGHVLGMPDLYHYEYSDAVHTKNNAKYLSVGTWDLMHYNGDTPNYLTTYLRNAYLDFTFDGQIVDLVKNGTYTLKPTTVASNSDVLAYRIVISDSESIWIEYRNNNVATYDSEQPGSGIIVYRVNTDAEDGNVKGVYKSTRYPDEVYVFRPTALGTGTSNETANLTYAYVSSGNTYFQKIGVDASNTSKYNQNAIYLTNGTNTGIIITPTSQNDEGITFTAALGSYDQTVVDSIKVENGRYEMYYGEVPNAEVKLKYKNSDNWIKALQSRLTYSYDPSILGEQTATVTYKDGYNELSVAFSLIIDDMAVLDSVAVNALPDKTEYDLLETVDLSGLILNVNNISGSTEEIVYIEASKSDWRVEGIDNTTSGVYQAKISYLPYNIYVFIEIKILTNLIGLEILKTDTMTVIRSGQTPILNIKGLNSDGTYRSLERAEYTISTYDNSIYFTRQVITVTLRADESFTDSVDVFVVKNTLTKIDVTNPTAVTYKFGEALNLSSGELRFEYSSGEYVTVPMENYYSYFNDTYLPNKEGEQSLSVKIDGQTCSLKVKVLTKSNSLLQIYEGEKEYINIVNNVINLTKAYTMQEFCQVVTSYLNIKFLFDDSFYVTEVTYPDKKVGANLRIELYNDSNSEPIMTYSVLLKGDANGDGEISDLDKSGWISGIMLEKSNLLNLDMNDDGVYTLTDFVILMSFLEDNE